MDRNTQLQIDDICLVCKTVEIFSVFCKLEYGNMHLSDRGISVRFEMLLSTILVERFQIYHWSQSACFLWNKK